MRFIGTVFICLFLATFSFGQSETEPEATPTPEITDRVALDQARKVKDPANRVEALESFLVKYADSDLVAEAGEFLTSSRATVADGLLDQGKIEEGNALFIKAVNNAPEPIPARLFREVLINIPTSLYLRRQPKAALDVADLLEVKSARNAARLLRIAAFHIGIKYATGARRVAEKALRLEEKPSADTFKVLADASRLGFDLQGAADNYALALELAPDNLLFKQMLAENAAGSRSAGFSTVTLPGDSRGKRK